MSSRKYLDLDYWNSKKDELLKYLENGCTYTQLGEVYNEERDFMVRVIYNLFNISIKNNPTDKILPFTKEELERRLVTELSSKSNIIREFGICKTKLNRIIKLFNIKLPNPNNHIILDYNFENVKKLIKEGKSYKDISKIYKVSPDVVRLFAWRKNINKDTDYESKKLRVKELLETTNLSFIEIGEELGLNKNTIYRWCKELGLFDKYRTREDHVDSNGEILIKKWLKDNKIEYLIRQRVDGISSTKTYHVFIDFIIFIEDIVIWIEYNGKQHYKFSKFFHKSLEGFENQLNRDERIKDYCRNNSIKLLEIPYTYNTYNKVKDLLDRVILGGEDINTIIDYSSLYKN